MPDLPDDEPKAPAEALSECESLIVRTYRKILLGQKDCPTLARDFRAFYGADAVEVYLTFCTLLRALAYASRRPLAVGYPGCGCLTGDERQLLSLIAAAQADDTVRFEAHLRWLARAELRVALGIALSAFASALRSHGQILRLARTQAPVSDDRALPPRLRLVGTR